MRGLFLSISNSLRFNKEESISLGKKRFDPSIAKALLYRIPVDFYKGPQFVTLLHEELIEAARYNLMQGPHWRLDDTGTLYVVENKKNNTSTTPEKKAIVRKFGI